MISLLFIGVFITSEKLQSHAMDCQKINDCAIRLPSVDDKWLEFWNHCNKERVPSSSMLTWSDSKKNKTRQGRCVIVYVINSTSI